MGPRGLNLLQKQIQVFCSFKDRYKFSNYEGNTVDHSYKADALVLKLSTDKIACTATADKVAHNCKGDEIFLYLKEQIKLSWTTKADKMAHNCKADAIVL